MRTLYSLAIGFYACGVRVASLFGGKAAQLARGWRRWRKRMDTAVLEGRPVAWFHAASLGEFEQARPVLEQFRRQHPDFKVVLTFFSPSGYEVRKNYGQADLVCYLPPDTRRNARRFVADIHPDVAFFVKYEFWYNYLAALRRNGTPTYLFSAIFRPSQYFFKWYGGWFARQLKGYSHLFVQNEESLHLLHSVGVNGCSLAGDTRFDRVYEIAQQAKRFPEIETFVASGEDYVPGAVRVLMAGSSWEPDEQCLQPFVAADKSLKVILAPHVIEETHLRQIETLFGPDICIRHSALGSGNGNNRQVLIIDNIGMLSALYRYATVACIGGGFGRGIHNILEATAFGCPVCFGPNHTKFQEALDLLDCGGARTFDNADRLAEILHTWLDDDTRRDAASAACTRFMERSLGATTTILNKALPR